MWILIVVDDYCTAISSVVRQKGEPLNGGYKKIKHAKFTEKLLYFTPCYAHVRLYI